MGSTIIEINDNAHNYSFCTVDAKSEHTAVGFLIMPFKHFYDFIFLTCVVIITLLYLLIYRKIYVSRKVKRNRELFYANLLRQTDLDLNNLQLKQPNVKKTIVKKSYLPLTLKSCCIITISSKLLFFLFIIILE